MEKFDKIILSPGPRYSIQTGLLLEVIKDAGKKPVRVYAGEQAMGEAFGGKLTNLSRVFHGVQTPSQLKRTNQRQRKTDYIFNGLPDGEVPVGRYHSIIGRCGRFP